MIVSKQKIRSINIGPITQVALLSGFAWTVSAIIQSFSYYEAISEKSEEITKLRTINSYFEAEFSDVNERLNKINEYLISISGRKHIVKAQEVIKDQDFKKPNSLQEEDFSKKDKQTYNHIKNIENQLEQVQFITENRIKKIEQSIEIAGLSMKRINLEKLHKKNAIKEISLNEGGLTNKQGGPIDDKNTLDFALKSVFSYEEDLQRKLEKDKFSSELDYLVALEKMVEVMPIARPMKNYYVSSGFGHRVDPITRRTAQHQGLDFVGPSKEKIISPSSGKVILAGRYSDYGNAIVIDHGFGITTRYGHLSEVKVVPGQKVKQGDIIALQGSTGRSTGSHLHYEVRYKNTPLNPRKFLEAGDYLINDEASKKYVDS